MVNGKLAIIFDIGGVLVDWNPRYLYRKLLANEAAVERFLAEICTPEWNVKQDSGRSLAEAVDELSAKYPDDAELIRAYYLRWEEMLGGAIEGTVDILRELKQAGYTMAALSNWSAETFPVAQHRFEFLNWFDAVVVSGEVKLIKPDPRIFKLLLAKLQRRAEDCVFIDDATANVTVARQLGFRTIHFHSPAHLRKELRQMGILNQ
jgi:2-haloacid dehalogenase